MIESNVGIGAGGVSCIAWLDVGAIKERQRKYAQIFDCARWTPDMLSESGHLGLVDVPVLVAEVEKQRKGQGKDGDADCDPRPNGIRAPEPPLQLVVPEQPVSDAAIVIEACNPLAHFLIVLLAKLPLGIRLRSHTSNENKISHRWRERAWIGMTVLKSRFAR